MVAVGVYKLIRKINKVVIPFLLIGCLLVLSGCSIINPRKNAQSSTSTTTAITQISISQKVENLTAQINDMNAQIANLNALIIDLQNQIDSLNNN